MVQCRTLWIICWTAVSCVRRNNSYFIHHNYILTVPPHLVEAINIEHKNRQSHDFSNYITQNEIHMLLFIFCDGFFKYATYHVMKRTIIIFPLPKTFVSNLLCKFNLVRCDKKLHEVKWCQPNREAERYVQRKHNMEAARLEMKFMINGFIFPLAAYTELRSAKHDYL